MTLKTNTRPPLPIYSLVEDQVDDVWVISVQDGEAIGVAYKYVDIKFVPGPESLSVKFNYRILHNPNDLPTTKLVDIMTIILDDILQKDSKVG